MPVERPTTGIQGIGGNMNYSTRYTDIPELVRVLFAYVHGQTARHRIRPDGEIVDRGRAVDCEQAFIGKDIGYLCISGVLRE